MRFLALTDIDMVLLKEETAFPLKDKAHFGGFFVTRGAHFSGGAQHCPTGNEAKDTASLLTFLSLVGNTGKKELLKRMEINDWRTLPTP